jgi:hypothetical protein
MMSTLGIDVFHAEGEVLIPRHLDLIQPAWMKWKPEAWKLLAQSLREVVCADPGMPAFASMKGWKWACNGRQKMETMIAAPLALVRLMRDRPIEEQLAFFRSALFKAS